MEISLFPSHEQVLLVVEDSLSLWVANYDDSKGPASMVNVWRAHPLLGSIILLVTSFLRSKRIGISENH